MTISHVYPTWVHLRPHVTGMAGGRHDILDKPNLPSIGAEPATVQIRLVCELEVPCQAHTAHQLMGDSRHMFETHTTIHADVLHKWCLLCLCHHGHPCRWKHPTPSSTDLTGMCISSQADADHQACEAAQYEVLQSSYCAARTQIR